jgi:hypothetical protein
MFDWSFQRSLPLHRAKYTRQISLLKEIEAIHGRFAVSEVFEGTGQTLHGMIKLCSVVIPLRS